MTRLTILLLGLLATAAAQAAPPKCSTQMLDGHLAELCVSTAPFQHDYYSLKIDHALIFVLPDDYVEDVALTHTLQDDEAIGFPLSRQGTPTVKISGGCVPVSEQREVDGKQIAIESARRCSFKWGNVDVLKDLIVHFE